MVAEIARVLSPICYIKSYQCLGKAGANYTFPLPWNYAGNNCPYYEHDNLFI